VDKVVFSDNWQGFFAEFGLKSFGDFFNYTGGETINKNNKRDVVAFDLGDGSRNKQFFIKRFFHPHFKDMLFTLRNFGEPCSQARCEWENANLLISSDIDTYKPVCYGEKTCCGIERKSFIVTEKLTSECLTDFVKQNWQRMSRQEKEKIVAGIAVFIRRIHENNFSLPDLYVWHIYLKENKSGDAWDFAVIDLHRMSHNVTNQKCKLENLGRLHHSMVDRYFDEDLKQLLIKSYAGNDWPGDINTLIGQVEKYSAKVSSKRNPKPY